MVFIFADSEILFKQAYPGISNIMQEEKFLRVYQLFDFAVKFFKPSIEAHDGFCMCTH